MIFPFHSLVRNEYQSEPIILFSEIERCDKNHGNCDSNGECEDLADGVKCICHDGYQLSDNEKDCDGEQFQCTHLLLDSGSGSCAIWYSLKNINKLSITQTDMYIIA